MTMLERLHVTPRQYRIVAYVTLAALTLIVMTGAAVRLTDSGLGCENWPKCGGTPLPPLSTHALIEFTTEFGLVARQGRRNLRKCVRSDRHAPQCERSAHQAEHGNRPYGFGQSTRWRRRRLARGRFVCAHRLRSASLPA